MQNLDSYRTPNGQKYSKLLWVIRASNAIAWVAQLHTALETCVLSEYQSSLPHIKHPIHGTNLVNSLTHHRTIEWLVLEVAVWLEDIFAIQKKSEVSNLWGW